MATLIHKQRSMATRAARRTARSVFALAASAIFVTILAAQDRVLRSASASFPDTAELMAEVAQDQKKVESLLSQYTFTDNTTVYTLDKNGKVKAQHTDTYYITPTEYEFFTLHVSHDGKSVSKRNLEEQEKKIERQIQQNERKAEKNGAIRPKDQLLFADIIDRSKFTPLRWEEVNGLRTIAYDFQPTSASRLTGSLSDRITGDLKGTMWISPGEKEVVRIEFASVSPLSLGMGLLGNVKGFQGFTEQQKIHGETWMPSRQEYVANGRQLVSGFRIREVSEFSDYLKASTDVFQQIHVPPASSGRPDAQ